jgi:hypothetical protein
MLAGPGVVVGANNLGLWATDTNGVLQLSGGAIDNLLSSNTEVHIFANGSITGVVDLAFTGTNKISRLFINEVDQGNG